MVWMGAERDTARQIWDVLELGLIGEVDDVQRAFGEVLQRIIVPASGSAKTSGSDFRMANRIYVDESYEIVEEFNRLLTSVFCSAGVGRVDFKGGDVERCRAEINGWVERETAGNVRDLVREDCLIDAATRIVIVNAVHLRGAWLSSASASASTSTSGGGDHSQKHRRVYAGPFYRRKFEEAVNVMMSEQKGAFQFAVDYDFKCKVLELAYAQPSSLSMLVFLPFDVEGLLVFENKLTPELIKFLKKSMTKTKLTVALPHIKLDQSMPMSPVLTRMGVEDLFSADRADLSGITGTRDLHFFELVHSVSLDACTSDEPTEPPPTKSASASPSNKKKPTSSSSSSVIASPRNRAREMAFIADHPFLFVIYDRPTKLIAFIGRFADPTVMAYELTGDPTQMTSDSCIQVKVEQF